MTDDATRLAIANSALSNRIELQEPFWAKIPDGAQIQRVVINVSPTERDRIVAALRAIPQEPVGTCREALEALSMWVTSERQKYRVAGGMPAGGFDHETPIEIALRKVELEIARRAALAPSAQESRKPSDQ